MLEYCIFTSLLLYQGFAVSLSRTECNGIECDDFPDCSNNSCLHSSKTYCDIYYICRDDTAQRFSCSAGLLFNEDNLTCDYENKVDCKNKTMMPPSVSSTQQVSTVKDLDLNTTNKYSYLSEVETTPITIKDIASSSQTDGQETTVSNSTLTVEGNEETKASTSIPTKNVADISSSTIDQEILQTNATDQRPVSEEVTSETTNHTQVSDENITQTTNQSHASDEDTSEITSQSQVSNEVTSETIEQSTEEDTSEATSQSTEEDTSEATSQSQDKETSEEVSITDSSTEQSKSTVKLITKEPITEKPTTTLSTISTDTAQRNITEGTTISLDTSSDSFTKRSSTSATPEYTSTQGQPSEETSDGNELIHNFTCPSRFGLFPDLENCNFFYQCSHFLPYHMQCPSELHFNPVLQVCDWPYEAGCENATSKDFESTTSTKIFSSTLHTTNVSFLSSSIAFTTIKHITDKIESTPDHVSSTMKNNISTDAESMTTKGVTKITENSTDIKTLVSNLPTTSMIDSSTTSKTNSTQETVDIKTTFSIFDNLTNTEVSSDNISPNETTTLSPQTDNDETSVNMTNSSEKTSQFESTLTDSVTKSETTTTEKTSSSKVTTTEIEFINITDTTLNPQTKTDFSEVTDSFETVITDLTTKDETIVTQTKFPTEKTDNENDMNDTTLNPELKTDSVETSSESEPRETDTISEVETSSEPEPRENVTTSEVETSSEPEPRENVTTSEVETSSEPEIRENITTSEVETSSESKSGETGITSEVETMETKIVTTFENITDNNKIITDAPELKTSSRKTDFEHTETVTDLQSSTLQNNFTASAFEIVSTIYHTTTPDYDQKTVSTEKEDITSTNTATQDFVTFTTSSVPVLNISTQSTGATSNVSLTETMQTTELDRLNLTTETLPEETSPDEIIQNFTCISRFGLFPDPESCNYFYQCSHFIPYHLQCPSDLHFNPILEVCDWPYEAGCVINSTDSSKETDKDFTPHPQNITASDIVSTSEYQTDETTREDTPFTETVSIEEKMSTEPNEILSTLKPTYKPNSTATPDVITFNETTPKTSNYSTKIITDLTPEVDTETTSTDEQVLTTKNNSSYSTIGFTNSTKEAEFKTSISTEQEFVTKNGSDYSTIYFTNSTKETEIETTSIGNEAFTKKDNDNNEYSTINFTNSTKEAEIVTTSSTEQEFITKNGSDYSTINFTNSTKEAEGETTTSDNEAFSTKNNNFSTINFTNSTKEEETKTTNFDRQDHTTKNNSDYSTITSTNSTKTEIVTLSELEELTSKSQTQMENETTKVDNLETTYDYKSTRVKSNDTAETTTVTSSNKLSTIDEIEQPLNFECPSRFGLYPDSQNCSRFYECSQWIANHMNCPPELHFNAILQVCDWPIDAGCENEESTFSTSYLPSTTEQNEHTDKSHPPSNSTEEASPTYDKNTNESSSQPTSIEFIKQSTTFYEHSTENPSSETTFQETSTINIPNEKGADFDCTSRFGLFPDQNNCSRFYQCSQWTPYPKQCPPGLHFNADLKVCDSPFEAGCDKSLITNEAARKIEEK